VPSGRDDLAYFERVPAHDETAEKSFCAPTILTDNRTVEAVPEVAEPETIATTSVSTRWRRLALPLVLGLTGLAAVGVGSHFVSAPPRMHWGEFQVAESSSPT
jgi:hypothetical protein